MRPQKEVMQVKEMQVKMHFGGCESVPVKDVTVTCPACTLTNAYGTLVCVVCENAIPKSLRSDQALEVDRQLRVKKQQEILVSNPPAVGTVEAKCVADTDFGDHISGIVVDYSKDNANCPMCGFANKLIATSCGVCDLPLITQCLHVARSGFAVVQVYNKHALPHTKLHQQYGIVGKTNMACLVNAICYITAKYGVVMPDAVRDRINASCNSNPAGMLGNECLMSWIEGYESLYPNILFGTLKVGTRGESRNWEIVTLGYDASKPTFIVVHHAAHFTVYRPVSQK